MYGPALDTYEDIPIDDAYDPVYMEEDGNYAQMTATQFNYEVDEELQPPTNTYFGLGPCLQRSVSAKVYTVLGCLQR